jgi:sodium-dependent dicarboxylate transporter 2/3/5
MLPVATPPNAVVFASGKVSAGQMAGAGLGLNLVAILLITTLVYLHPGFTQFQGSAEAVPVWTPLSGG